MRTRSRYFLLAWQIFLAPGLADRAGGKQPVDLSICVVQGAENSARGGSVLLRGSDSHAPADSRTDGGGVELRGRVTARMIQEDGEGIAAPLDAGLAVGAAITAAADCFDVLAEADIGFAQALLSSFRRCRHEGCRKIGLAVGRCHLDHPP